MSVPNGGGACNASIPVASGGIMSATNSSRGSAVSFLRTFLPGVILAFIIIIPTIFMLTFVFVRLLRYDYVTTSSVYFSISLIAGLFEALVMGLSLNSKWTAVFVLGRFVFLSLVFSVGFNIYEYFMHPTYSNALDILRLFRTIAVMPLNWIAGRLSSMGPEVAALVRLLDGGAILNQSIAAILASIVSFSVRGLGARKAITGKVAGHT